MKFGAAVRPDQLEEGGPLTEAIRSCDLLVPEYHGQWSAVEWRQGDPWFGNYDAIADFAAKHGQTARGHSLIWEQMTPDWARDAMRNPRDWRFVERHFANLLGRYRNRIHEWVVVNEMIDTEEGDANMRRTTFQRAFGNSYVAEALKLSHSIDPGARLMINEYGLCHDNPVDERRRVALLELVEDLKAKGVPLHTVGIQGHLEIAKGPIPQDRLARLIDDLAATGVDIALTEVDVLEADRDLPVSERDAKVTEYFSSLMDVVEDRKAVTSLTTWGLSDRHSWLQDRSETDLAAIDKRNPKADEINRGLPFDSAMQLKLPGKVLFARLDRRIGRL